MLEDGGNNVSDGVVHNDHRGQGRVLVPLSHTNADHFSN